MSWREKRRRGEGKRQELARPCWSPIPGQPYPHAVGVGAGASVYMAAVMENLAAEFLESAGNAAGDNNKTRIIPDISSSPSVTTRS